VFELVNSAVERGEQVLELVRVALLGAALEGEAGVFGVAPFADRLGAFGEEWRR
jgi:hypothetical protein